MDEIKTCEALKNLPSGGCYILSAPMFEMNMCGVADARISHDGRVKLTYIDGYEEIGRASDEILGTCMDDHNLFAWVSCVQGQRAKEE